MAEVFIQWRCMICRADEEAVHGVGSDAIKRCSSATSSSMPASWHRPTGTLNISASRTGKARVCEWKEQHRMPPRLLSNRWLSNTIASLPSTTPPHSSISDILPKMPAPEPWITPHLPYRSDSKKLSPSESPVGTPTEYDYNASVDHHQTSARRPPTIGGSGMLPPRQRPTRKQEIQNDFRHLATIGFTSLVMGTWELLLTANATALTNGGLSTFFWSMI